MEQFVKTIYKKDSKGKIRQLTIEALGDHVIQISGIVGGKLTRQGSKCHPKNIGKANATTAIEQAVLEAKAKVLDKLSGEYFWTADEAKTVDVILPMLAKDYNKEKSKIVYPCYGQPKLDGMRALASSVNPMISRKGKEITTMKHIQADINGNGLAHYFDGELYAHGKSFQENMKLIKKDRGDDTKEVKYHVYDMILPNHKFSERYILLKRLVETMKNVELVHTVVLNNETELKEFHKENIAAGYEGTIVRHSNTGYGINRRDSQLLKYKDFLDRTYKVVDVVPSESKPTHGVVHCVNGEGQTFGCGMKFSHKEREEILLNKDDYIGQTAEIRFFEFTDDGIPRFPVCHGFRLDK